MSKLFPLHLVLPEMKAHPSGGNLFNYHLVQSLEAQGVEFRLLDWDTFCREFHRPEAGSYWIDTLFLTDLRALAISKLAMPTFLIVHHLESLWPPDGTSSDEWFRLYEAPLLELFAGFFVTSPFTREYLEKRGVPPGPVVVVEPALCFEPSTPVMGHDPVRALMVANLVSRKGVLPFLENLLVEKDEAAEFELQIIGTPDIEPEYAQRCRDIIEGDPWLKDRVRLGGKVSPEDIPGHYRKSNLMISPAYMETFGMALQEAVASHLPILAYDGGNAQKHVRPGQTGQLFSSHREMARTLLNLASNPDPLRQWMQNCAGYNPYEHYHWQDAAQSFINQIHSLDRL